MRKNRFLSKKLSLHRETLHSLEPAWLGDALGGFSGRYGPGCASVEPNCNGTDVNCPTDVGPCSFGHCDTLGSLPV